MFWKKENFDYTEIDISDHLMKEASEVYNKMKDINYSSTVNLGKYRDFYGVLGQHAVLEKIRDWGFDPIAEKYFDEDNRQGDQFDLYWRYQRCDVKASPTSKDFPKVYPKSRLLLRENTKEVDTLIFAKVNVQERKVYVPGVISWDRFHRISKPFQSENMKHPCYWIQARDLSSFRKFVYGV